MNTDRLACDAAGERVNCPPGAVAVAENGHTARAEWSAGYGVTRKALFRVTTNDGVAVLQHIRTIHHSGCEPARCAIDLDVRLKDIPRSRLAALHELGLTPAEEGGR